MEKTANGGHGISVEKMDTADILQHLVTKLLIKKPQDPVSLDLFLFLIDSNNIIGSSHDSSTRRHEGTRIETPKSRRKRRTGKAQKGFR